MVSNLDTFLLTDIGELVTFEKAVSRKCYAHLNETHLGLYKNAWLTVKNGKVHAFGTDKPPQNLNCKIISAAGKLVTPGLVDPHTHPIFAGNRAHEFLLRSDGYSYQDIAARGGGIQSTVRATRGASDEFLHEKLIFHAETMRSWGVTTFEAKSGYGLSVDEELRHLKILAEARRKIPQTIVRTCLALHAIPKDQTKQAFIQQCKNELLEKLKADDLAEGVDAFVEEGYFSAEDVRDYFKKARALDLQVRIHADEFSHSGGAALAADIGALSADHLQYTTVEDFKVMAAAQVMAIFLPGTSLFSAIPFTLAGLAREAGCALAIGSDFNPGSCPVNNLPLAMSLACIHNKFTPVEALAGVTWVAAKSLGLENRKGALVSGYDADLVVHSFATFAEYLADMGQTKPQYVFIAKN